MLCLQCSTCTTDNDQILHPNHYDEIVLCEECGYIFVDTNGKCQGCEIHPLTEKGSDLIWLMDQEST